MPRTDTASKEKLPSNLLEYTVPAGMPEVIREGEDITIVSYGSVLRIIMDAVNVIGKSRHKLRSNRCTDITAFRY